MSTTPPNDPENDPWNRPPGYEPPPPPPPPQPGPPPGQWPGNSYPPPGGGSYPPPPPPPRPPGYPGDGYPGGGYPGGGYPGGGYPGGGYPNPGYYPGSGPMSPFGPLAGWWRRVGATVVDGIIISLPVGIVLAVLGLSGYGLSAVDDIFIVIYQIILLGAPRGQTVGNMAVGTRVVDAVTGAPIGVSKAAARAIVELVLNVTVIGGILDVLWPLWDQRNQTLHDKAAGSLVVMIR